MDNFESIFRSMREQLESEINRMGQNVESNEETNSPRVNIDNSNDDAFLIYTYNMIRDYLAIMRLHQETISFFNVNMYSLLDILRQEQGRRRATAERRMAELRRIETVRRNDPFNFGMEPPIARQRTPPTFTSNVRTNRPFEGRNSSFVRSPIISDITDISTNIRRSLPTLINPRIRSPLDGRHFFGGLQPDLRDVVIRPTPEEINLATRRFVYSPGAEIFNSRCYITMEDFEEGDNIREILHCKHAFKNNALLSWFSDHVKCPVCRFDIRDYVPENNENNQSENELNSSRSSSSESFLESQDYSSSNQSSPIANTNPARSENLIYREENLVNDVSDGINNILDSLVSDLSNNSLLSSSLRYSLSVPLIYHEFYDASNNMSFNNYQFSPTPSP